MPTMPDAFHRIPDRFKTQEMCDKVVKDDSSSLQFVPDWLVTQEQISLWADDIFFRWFYDGNDKFISLMMMKIILLSGMMVIKDERLKKQK